MGRHKNIAADHRILDRRRGPIKKTAAVRLLPSLQANKNTQDNAETMQSENMSQLGGDATQSGDNDGGRDGKYEKLDDEYEGKLSGKNYGKSGENGDQNNGNDEELNDKYEGELPDESGNRYGENG